MVKIPKHIIYVYGKNNLMTSKNGNNGSIMASAQSRCHGKNEINNKNHGEYVVEFSSAISKKCLQ